MGRPQRRADALLRRARALVDLRGIARVGVHEHELADVVQQRGDHDPVAVVVTDLGGQAVGGALGGDAVQAEALGSRVPGRGALEEVEGPGARGERLDGLGREQLDGRDDGLHLAAALALDLVAEAQHGDDERDVALDGRDHVARGDALLLDDAQQPVARLGERRECFKRFEGGGQPAAVALVVVAGGAARILRGSVHGRGGVGHMETGRRVERWGLSPRLSARVDG